MTGYGKYGCGKIFGREAVSVDAFWRTAHGFLDSGVAEVRIGRIGLYDGLARLFESWE